MKSNFNIFYIFIIFFILFIIIVVTLTTNKQIKKNNKIESFNYDDKEVERHQNINNIFDKIKKFFIRDFEININCKLSIDNIKLLDKNFNHISNCCMQKILQIYKNNYDLIFKEIDNFPKIIDYCLNKGFDLNNCVQENQIQSIYYILNNLKISKNNDELYNILIVKIIKYVLNNDIKFGYKKCDYLKFCEFDSNEIKILNNFKINTYEKTI